jgi:hypothetical protein
MRRLSRVSIITVFAIALTQMAMAADLPRKAPAYTPPLPPVFSLDRILCRRECRLGLASR